MTKPEEYTIHEIIQMIEGGEIKLPIFQRRYVWSTEQVKNLFSTVFNDNPFGAISAIKTTDDYPIFASRTFFEDLKDKYQLSEYNDGQNHSKDNPLYLILDGQQRLQSFYLGLTSKFDDMELCFNKQDGTFNFYAEYDKKEYISVKQLYKKLGNNTYEKVAQIFNADNVEIVNKNIFKFYYHFFFQKRIVMLLAYPQGEKYLKEDQTKLFELFVRLNSGGKVLDVYDLYVSKLKAYNPLWEELFTKIDKEFGNVMYYPYSLPFHNIDDRLHLEQKYLLNGYAIFIPVIYYCFNNKYNKFNDISDNWLETISKCIKKGNDVDKLFDFICIIFDLCRIINIDNNQLTTLINQLYIENTNNQDNVNLEDFTINHYLNAYSHYQSKFENYNSWKLFIYKYYLIEDIDTEYREIPYILNCNKIDNSQIYEIQIDKFEGHNLAVSDLFLEYNIDDKKGGKLEIPIYDILDNTYNMYKFKYADDIVEDELNKTIIDFKKKWEERAKASAEWKTVNDNYIKYGLL